MRVGLVIVRKSFDDRVNRGGEVRERPLAAQYVAQVDDRSGRTTLRLALRARIRDDSALGRTDGHQRGENMTATGENRWPPAGRNR
jgi:hypothetical protein